MADRTDPDEQDGTEALAPDCEELRARHEHFVRIMAHDVRNPLQVILLQAERLQRLLPEPESRERRAADVIAVAVRQLDALIRQRVREARGEEEHPEDGAGAARGR
ncbi:histidine kinase dimerization/phospho-acceptor domain-containing protein [Anaeromyxobacter paludicola]|uniref:histidine kinase n=1 Tax=Anaeromyxobacter paludicola TaxID=2918171 RepID=A0ABN6NDL2_9BACT|nr:histidine kinase dimerization/phospho-acceptor domain-containing protein [Anaeromyxobacter paludicola]BDG10132.1 hypothetical protein AMPC_32450 [Anaeromyxobacter paludicola]